ncbi:MAG: biotin transporter BioY [Candidatus Methanofastidiosia archaeon]
MEITVYINKYKRVRYDFFKWRYELNILHKVALAFGFACITGLLAQFRFYLPWTPVPITGQTFAVLLSGILLGRWGGISQIIYAGIGAAGVPWFAGRLGGMGVITGPTGGYIIGFIIAAFFLGYFVDRYIRSRSFLAMFALMLFANFMLIHGPGLLQLYLWLSLVKGTSIGIWELLMMGTIPFIVGDVTKVVVAAVITRGIVPKRAYNGEVDTDKWKSWRIP